MSHYKQVFPAEGKYAIFKDPETGEVEIEPLFAIGIYVDDEGEEYLTGIVAGNGITHPCIKMSGFVDYISYDNRKEKQTELYNIWKELNS